MTTIYKNARIFTADEESPITEAIAVERGEITAIGIYSEVLDSIATSENKTAPNEIDLQGRFMGPGFIDSHTHLLSFGTALGKAQLRDCATLEEIRERLIDWRNDHPDASRVVGISWLFDALGEELPTAAMLDDIFPDIPVYLDANDLHSAWLNSAALKEAGISHDTPDPLGGKFERDEDGNPTGLLYETAAREYAWDFLENRATEADLVTSLERAFSAYLATGVTGATDMAITPPSVKGLRAILKRDGRLPFPVTGHYLMFAYDDPNKNLQQVNEVIRLRDELEETGESAWFSITGVKFIMDGVIDAKTATMCCPYADGTNTDPIWNAESIKPVAAAVDAAGLQIAMHAIGDKTSEIAIETLEYCAQENGLSGNQKHRIEHLESVTDETIQRMSQLGCVASMQPVHSDPAVLDNWKAVLGDERQEEGFPWHKFRDAGVYLTLGTDAPTAPHDSLANLYIALTGRSTIDPSLPAYHPERAFSPEQALQALTLGGAVAGRMANVGKLAPGYQANFIILDRDLLNATPEEILSGKVAATIVQGELSYGNL